jgi:hypothetical protein
MSIQTNRLGYGRGADLQLVDLFECPSDDDEGEEEDPEDHPSRRDWTPPDLPDSTLFYRPAGGGEFTARIIDPWLAGQSDAAGFVIHFAVTPRVSPESYDVEVIRRSLWESYRASANGLNDRIQQLYHHPQSGPLAAYWDHMYRTMYEDMRHTQRLTGAPRNFGTLRLEPDGARPFEKGSPCSYATHSVLVFRNVPNLHLALWLAQRVASPTSTIGRAKYAPSLLLPILPGSGEYMVVQPGPLLFGAPAQAWPLVPAMMWSQLPVWRQGTQYVLAGDPQLPSYLGSVVHVLPPHAPSHQPLTSESGAVAAAAAGRTLFGDSLDDMRGPTTTTAEEQPIIVPKKNTFAAAAVKERPPPLFSASKTGKSAFRAKEFIHGARRTYASRPVTAAAESIPGPLSRQPLLQVTQGLARGDDTREQRTARAPAKKRKHDEAVGKVKPVYVTKGERTTKRAKLSMDIQSYFRVRKD